MDAKHGTTYRVIQLGAPQGPLDLQLNRPVIDFDDLEMHHPRDNRNARMQDGVFVDGQPGRIQVVVDGAIEEVEISRGGRTHGLKPHQVLLKKDFILENPNIPKESRRARIVDVPSPMSGYIGRVDDDAGLVDIYDRKDGDVIARIRHMHNIPLAEGDLVAYGQALGIQSDRRTGKVHVHMEIDTRYYQQYRNYITDLISGRLPVEAEHRHAVWAQPIADDGAMRLGESGERVATLQRALVAEGYRGVGGKPVEIDGIYRLNMQGAVLAFQQDHRLPQTGDIDPATYELALRVNVEKPLGPVQPRLDDGASRVPRDGPLHRLYDIDQGLERIHAPIASRVQDRHLPADPARTGRTPHYHPHSGHMQRPAPFVPDAPRESVPEQDHGDRPTPERPGRPLYEIVREKTRSLHAEHGITLADDELSRLAAGVTLDARRNGMTHVDHLLFSENRKTGEVELDGNLIAIQGRLDDPANRFSATSTPQAAQTPIEETFRQLEIVDQQQNQRLAQFQEQQQQLNQSAGGPKMTL